MRSFLEILQCGLRGLAQLVISSTNPRRYT
jgi:hypothetical protein